VGKGGEGGGNELVLNFEEEAGRKKCFIILSVIKYKPCILGYSVSVYATHKWQILHLENDAAFYLLFLFCLLNSFHPIKVVIGHPS